MSTASEDPFDAGLGDFMNGGYTAMVKEVLASANEELGGQAEGLWEIYDEVMAPDFTLSAPDGCVIELDGRCSHGYVSPVRGAGLV